MPTLDDATNLGGVTPAMGQPVPAASRLFWTPAFGRSFVSPAIDIVFVCGAFSLLLLLLRQSPFQLQLNMTSSIVLLVVCNYAHFTSSTVRLYTKAGATARNPFVARGLPFVAVAVTLLAVLFPVGFGKHLMALAVTWSPYHYAAQAFGLALMYSYRSGMTLSAREKRWLWWICMLPFLRALINIDDPSLSRAMGIGGAMWLLPEWLTADGSLVAGALRTTVGLMTPLVFALPVLFACVGRSRLPVLALALLLVNSLWMTAFSFFDAVVSATVAHSVQYLIIITHTHAKDAARVKDADGPARSNRYHMATFYGLSLGLGIPLFVVMPWVIMQGGALLGQEWGYAHCYVMVIATLNLHHFIVDGYIWRSPKQPSSPPVAPVPARA